MLWEPATPPGSAKAVFENSKACGHRQLERWDPLGRAGFVELRPGHVRPLPRGQPVPPDLLRACGVPGTQRRIMATKEMTNPVELPACHLFGCARGCHIMGHEEERGGWSVWHGVNVAWREARAPRVCSAVRSPSGGPAAGAGHRNANPAALAMSRRTPTMYTLDRDWATPKSAALSTLRKSENCR